MKRVLGLDLGTTSIGWAYVIEDKSQKDSEIKQIGVRVNPLTTGQGGEADNFMQGKSIDTNSGRTLSRGARRTLNRYQLRRKLLVKELTKAKIINEDINLNEAGANTTHQTWAIRSKAATERIELNELAKILLAINKKRGYKSSRKAKNEEEGSLIDSMAITKTLFEQKITPGQYTFNLLKEGKKTIPDFYRSDLKAEFDAIWEFQQAFHPEILTDDFYVKIEGKGQRATSALFWSTYNFNTADIKDAENKLKTVKTAKYTKNDFKKLQAYYWRSIALKQELDREALAYVLTEINNNINKSSGYLGEISDRSKELYFNKETIGQYLYKQLQDSPHNSLKNQVFYRQDYLDEFEKIWETQKKFYPQLTEELKVIIRDIIIFYQRPLKSQKSLISFCEFESKEIEKIENGKPIKRKIGSRVIPKSSHLFQEFKIWQNLGHVLIRKKTSATDKVRNEKLALNLEQKEFLFEELNLKGNLKATDVLKLLGLKPKDWEINYTSIEGNRTNQQLYNAYLKILEIEGYNEDLLKLSNKDDIDVNLLKTPAHEIKTMVSSIFEALKVNTKILDFDAEIGDDKEFQKQDSQVLWHLIYSAEDDTNVFSEEEKLTYGNHNIRLKKQLCKKFGFKPEHAKILSNTVFQDDYGSLSSKAIRKIIPYLKENEYSKACDLAGYRHSKHSLTKEEIDNRELQSKLEVLPKNSLRNPVVEKILNQMINLVNTLIDKENEKLTSQGKKADFRFDEIRIELARELKRNASERAEMTIGIAQAKRNNDKIAKILQTEFKIPNPTRNDIIKYRLYEELAPLGYKDLYTNEPIPREKLFSKEIDIEHILPQSKIFDDSFSNKTVVYREENRKKGNRTAYDYIKADYGEEKLNEYLARVEMLYKAKTKDKGLSKAKYLKLLKKETEIGEGFIERDLRNSQYIARKAKEILFQITPSVLSTTGSVTARLREDWGLINIMKEINLPKYRALNLTEMEERKYGQKIEVIKDWTKRDDHRHHAMDALTVAFTKHNHIQYLNNLSARKNESHKDHKFIIGIEEKEMVKKTNDEGNYKKVFKEPIPNFRKEAKEHLESIFVSHKAKNKVVTRNKNKIKAKKGHKTFIELTPRGQLHKETVYGKYKSPKVKMQRINARFDEEMISKVATKKHRELLMQRLKENDMDSKKAFAGKNALSKNPIFLDKNQTIEIPVEVKTVVYESDFSIRKEVSPDNFKNERQIVKVLDARVRKILLNRFKEHNKDANKAFSNLDENPIWLNKEKGIKVKRVKISGVTNATPLHTKKDHFGNKILDENGNEIPTSYVSLGNNHHVAIYKDEKGKLQEKVTSFFEAVERAKQKLSIIDKTYNQHLGWEFMFSMKQNEMFVFPNEDAGFDPQEIDLLDPDNKKEISKNLFRVQTISIVKYGNSTIRDFKFRNHIESMLNDNKLLNGKSYQQIKSLEPLRNIKKVRLNHLGDIVHIGEY